MTSLASLAVAAVALVSTAAPSKEAAAPQSAATQTALADIKSTLGFVPSFMQAMADDALPGAWAEMKAIQMSDKTVLSAKYKELIGLGVAAQVPCEYCVYFHTKAAKANGASDKEIKEAVAMASVVRNASTVLNGSLTDEATFKKDLDAVIAAAKASANKPAPERVQVTDAASAREDIKRTMGSVPAFFNGFPPDALPGFWRQLKEFQMSTTTAIPPKYKELIGLGVAAQIPCKYCTAFHTEVATKLHGTSSVEVQETLAMAGIVRQWSTVLNGMQVDLNQFKKDTDRLTAPQKKAAAGAGVGSAGGK